MVYNKIYAQLGEERHIVLDPINYQYDVKQILVLTGETVPDYYEADVCNVGDTATLTMVGTAADGVEIPDKFLQDGRNVLVYVVIPGSGGDVQTRYDITIPVDERAEREDIDPSEAEQQQIDSLINALNSGVGRAEAAATAAAESATDAEGSATAADGSAEDAEAWSVGQRAGEDVPDTDPTYHNNSKYYAGMAKAAAEEAGQHEARWETWVQRAETAAGNAESSATAAGQSKTAAETAAQAAAQKATEAGNSAAAASSSAASARQTVDGAIGAINTARDGALTAIGSAGSNAVGAVAQAGTMQTGRVTTEGNTQVNRVQEKGDEVIGSIPPDYSDLADDVANLSRHLSDFKESVFDSEDYLALTKSSEDFTVEEGYYATRYGKNPLAGYNLYYFVAAKDFDFYCSDYTLQYGQALIIAIYNNGVISSENYVRDYRRDNNNLPTSENKASVSEGQVFAVSLYTPASSPEKFEIFANYKNVLLNGDIVLAQSQVDQVVDSFINVSAPFIFISKSASNDFTVEDGYYAGAYGKQPLSGYKLYSITAEKDFNFYFSPSNTIPSGGTLMASIYNGDITQAEFVRRYSISDSNLPTENNKASVNKGQILAISIYTPSGDPKDFGLYANYKYVYTLPEKIEVVTAIKNFALHKKCAWFGDSISQLKQLPHTTGNLLHMDVYDCSVKGSCIGRTYSNFNSFSFSNLVTAVIAHDFTQQYEELEAQEQATGQDLSDIRENLDTLSSITVDDWKNNIDYVVLLQGTNDFAIPIHAASGYESRLDETKALMKSAISRLLVFAPQLQFYIFTPFYRGDSITADVDGRPLTDYVSMEQNVADEYAIPCCNLMTSSRICADTEVIYLNQSDHIHPSDYGDTYLAEVCAKFIATH